MKWVPEGTGKMIDMLEKNEVDVALTVSDALLVAIAKGRKVKLSGTFVPSPLIWAISTSPENSSIQNIQELLENKRRVNPEAGLDVGISRLGSGSQTMAYYMNDRNTLDASLNFTVANNFEGLKNGKFDCCSAESQMGWSDVFLVGVQQNQFDLFLWETFTTKPFFDTHQLHKVSILNVLTF